MEIDLSLSGETHLIIFTRQHFSSAVTHLEIQHTSLIQEVLFFFIIIIQKCISIMFTCENLYLKYFKEHWALSLSSGLADFWHLISDLDCRKFLTYLKKVMLPRLDNCHRLDISYIRYEILLGFNKIILLQVWYALIFTCPWKKYTWLWWLIHTSVYENNVPIYNLGIQRPQCSTKLISDVISSYFPLGQRRLQGIWLARDF